MSRDTRSVVTPRFPRAGLHLPAEVGGVCTGLGHGLRHTVSREADESHLRDLSPSWLGPAHGESSHALQDDRQENVSDLSLVQI